jgi:hypothetical protein
MSKLSIDELNKKVEHLMTYEKIVVDIDEVEDIKDEVKCNYNFDVKVVKISKNLVEIQL